MEQLSSTQTGRTPVSLKKRMRDRSNILDYIEKARAKEENHYWGMVKKVGERMATLIEPCPLTNNVTNRQHTQSKVEHPCKTNMHPYISIQISIWLGWKKKGQRVRVSF